MSIRTGGNGVPFQLSVNTGAKVEFVVGNDTKIAKFEEKPFSIPDPGPGQHTFEVWQNEQDVYIDWIELTSPNTKCKFGVKGNFPKAENPCIELIL